MSVEENLREAEKLLNAYNEHKLDLLVKFWVDKKKGLARLEFQKNFWLTAFPDTHMEVIRRTAQDDIVVVEAIVSATHMGPLKFWVSEPIPATNKKIEFHVCEVSQWENGKLKDIKAYLDRGQILKQLGIIDKVDWSIWLG